MPQSPILGGATDGISPAGMFTTRGGALTKLNMTAANVVKAAKGRIARFIILGAGTGGAWTLNDTTATGSAGAANAIITLPGTTAAGTSIDLDVPCANGIVLSSVPTGGTPIAAISYR